MNVELETYLNRPELSVLTPGKKELLRRYIRRFGGDYPVGRPLALGLLRLNDRYANGLISKDFIFWLYSY